MSFINIRGAITAENTREDILAKTETMLKAIIDENNIKTEDILSVLFTATKDLDKVYPAVAARGLGITRAALMCMQEMYVEGSLPKCIRVMVTVKSDKAQAEANHVYLGEAERLRPDLKK